MRGCLSELGLGSGKWLLWEEAVTCVIERPVQDLAGHQVGRKQRMWGVVSRTGRLQGEEGKFSDDEQPAGWQRGPTPSAHGSVFSLGLLCKASWIVLSSSSLLPEEYSSLMGGPCPACPT